MSNIPTNKVAVAACPFCGGTDTACGIADEEFGRFWVECICGARGPTVETLKDARPAWNKRLAPEPDGRLAKAAELLREVRAYDSHRDNTLACEFTAEGWIEERDEWLASLSTTKAEK